MKKLWPYEVLLLKEMRNLLLFAWPIIYGNLGQMLIGVGDVWVAGHAGPGLLAALSVANALFTPCLVLGLGMLVVLSPYLARKRGEGHTLGDLRKELQKIALLLSIVCSFLLFFFSWFVYWVNGDSLLTQRIQHFLWGMIPSFYPTFLFIAYKEYLQAEGKNRRANLLTLLAVLLNLGLNYCFVILLPMGEWGLALGTNICRWFMLFGLIFPRHILEKGISPSFQFDRKEIIRLGFPVSCSFLLEVGAFSLTTFLAGRFGELQVSAHQIVLTWTSLTFMIPLGVSSAVSTLIGHSLGSQQFSLIKWQMKASLLVSGLVMTVTAIIFLFFPVWPLRLFTQDPGIIELGIHFFMVAAFFQIFDGLQVTLSGILRGLNKTKATFVANVLSFWVVAIPCGLFLAYKQNMQVEGFWLGLAVGLFVATIFLSITLYIHWKNLIPQMKMKAFKG